MKIQNILLSILTLVLGLIALGWLVSPESSANSIDMVLLEGKGRNTQIRDFTALFLGTSIMSLLSLITRQYQWVLSAGIIFSIMIVVSFISSFYHDSIISYQSLIAEIIFAAIAISSALLLKFKN
jgi:hypothetical protein|tara:strand:+ start:2207 stop:2581 length:375 start_codon:yes stop_codon:yes gene_type:complete